MEVSIVATAAPKIVESLGGLSFFSWIFTSYLLAATVFMPAWGRIADHFGHKIVILVALGIFLLGSFLCGLSHSILQLLGARLIQGIGAGALVPLSFTMLSDFYTYRQRARVQGLASAVWGFSSVIGPFIGGLLTDYVHWRFIFFVNLIPGIPTLWLFAKYLPRQQNPEKLKLSPKSFATSVVGIATFILSLSLVQQGEFKTALWSLLACVLTAFLFWHYEKTEQHPFINREIFKQRIVLAGCVTGFLFSGTLIGISSFAPLLFQIIYRYPLTASGLLICPLSLAWVFGSFFSIEMAIKYHYKKVIFSGMLITMIGLLLFLNSFYHLSTASIVVTFILIGVGMAFNYPIVLVVTQHGVPKNLVSFATSTLVWTRNLGATVITTIMGVALHQSFTHKLQKLGSKNLNHDFIQLYLDNPKLLQKPATLLHVQVDPLINQGFHEALFAAFAVLVVTSTLALFLTRLFPEKVELRE